jgi:hypothetical protein
MSLQAPHHGHAAVGFQHGVVDALRTAGLERGRRRAHPVQVGLALRCVLGRCGQRQGLGAGRENVGRVLVQRLQQHARLAQEDAGVPQHAALQQQVLGGGGVGLFDEAADAARGAVGQGLALLDVAVGGAGKAGHHAEGDDLARLGGRHAGLHHLAEGGGIGDVVVGRAEQQQGVTLPGVPGLQRGQCHGGGGVAALGLQDGLHGAGNALQRVGHQEAVFFGRHHHEVGPQRRHALGRELQQAVPRDQWHELLGKALAAERPQACARAAAEDDGKDGRGHGLGTVGEAHTAPSWRSTTRTVRTRMTMSYQTDQLRTYQRSMAMRCWKLLLLRPLICHRPVMPGRARP